MKKALFTCLLFCLGQIAFAADLTVTVTHSSSGLNNGAIDLTVSGGVSPFAYSWKGPAGYNANTQDISGLAPGTYIVTVTDTYCGSATLTVQVNGPTGISEISGFAFSVYPNPAKREISITTAILLT